MSYKTLVVEQAVASLKDGGFAGAEAFRLLFERIYDCGYNEAIRNFSQVNQNTSSWKGCFVCGLGSDGKITAYVCNNPNCPTKITCT